MTGTSASHWIAECYWPGVQESELRDLGRRIVHATNQPAGTGGPAGYLGCLQVTDDDVVLFLFQGAIGSVRQVAENAGIRAERILRCIPNLEPTPAQTPAEKE